MSLANLANIPTFDDEKGFDIFNFSNMNQHRLAIEAISAQRQIELPVYPFDPVPAFAFEDFLQSHQAAHNDINGVLGVQGVDLSAVDFRDAAQAADWTRLHLSEHQQWAQILRLT